MCIHRTYTAQQLNSLEFNNMTSILTLTQFHIRDALGQMLTSSLTALSRHCHVSSAEFHLPQVPRSCTFLRLPWYLCKIIQPATCELAAVSCCQSYFLHGLTNTVSSSQYALQLGCSNLLLISPLITYHLQHPLRIIYCHLRCNTSSFFI